MASDNSSSRTFVLAARGSQLSQVQTNIAVASLQALFPDATDNGRPSPKFTTSFMSTGGDKNQSQALYLLGGKALWTKELEIALQDHEADMLVHSFKDVPTALPEGFIIGAVLEREDPVDSLVVKRGAPWKNLEDMPAGSVIGTSSVRRVAQLKRSFPKLKFMDVRGNLNTRFAKLDAPDGPYDALVLAKAGIVRLGMGDRITADLHPPTLYYAVSQGALAIEVRSDDAEAIALCRKLTHWETEWQCLAERACLRVLEGGCSVPVGMYTKFEVEAGESQAGVLIMTGCVTGINGDVHVEHTLTEQVASAEQADDAGKKLGRILLETGAQEILQEINKDRDEKVQTAKITDAQVAA